MSNAILDELWVAEYSSKQEYFIVESFNRAMRLNSEKIKAKEQGDYLIFGVFKTVGEAEQACDNMRREQNGEV